MSIHTALTSDNSRSIAFDAGLTCVGSKGPSFEQQGQLTAPDAAILSVRHMVHTSALHINSSGCERTLAHIAHFSSSKIDSAGQRWTRLMQESCWRGNLLKMSY